MTQMSRFLVTVVLTRNHTSETLDVEVLAYNRRQAEKKASNQVLNRSSKVLSARAALMAA